MRPPGSIARNPVREKMVDVDQYASQPTTADNPKWHASHPIMYEMGNPHNIYTPQLYDLRNRFCELFINNKLESFIITEKTIIFY
jgi:hypothetical protein